MEWTILVLVVEILLLAMGWVLFQQAKSDLTARAAETPVLGEVKTLHNSIVRLLEQLKLESSQSSAQLEARCLEARDLLAALDEKLAVVQPSARLAAPKPSRRAVVSPKPAPAPGYDRVYSLADDGVSAAQIAEQAGLSEGEVELILGLRANVG